MTHRIATITVGIQYKIKYSSKTYIESIGIAKNHTGNKITTVLVRRSAG